jgi:hypothetical protein
MYGIVEILIKTWVVSNLNIKRIYKFEQQNKKSEYLAKT